MVNKIVKAPVPKKRGKFVAKKLLARLCYEYPQYTYEEARELPINIVTLLLDQAEQVKAQKYLDLLAVVSAPHGKKGTIKKIQNGFLERLN